MPVTLPREVYCLWFGSAYYGDQLEAGAFRQEPSRLIGLIRTLVRPYRGTLFIILLAMIVQTVMSVAGPWPLKIVLDNVVGSHKLRPWLEHLLSPMLSGGSKMQIAAAAALAAIIIAALGALASYIA